MIIPPKVLFSTINLHNARNGSQQSKLAGGGGGVLSFALEVSCEGDSDRSTIIIRLCIHLAIAGLMVTTHRLLWFGRGLEVLVSVALGWINHPIRLEVGAT